MEQVEEQTQEETAEEPFDFGDDAEDRSTTDTADFVPILPPDVSTPGRPAPTLGDLMEVLSEHRLLIIAGSASNKRELARRCAWEMAEYLRDEAPDDDPPVALEKRPALQSFDLLLHLESRKEPAVFVLPHMDPAEINRNLTALKEAAGQRHWVLIATDRPRESWHLDSTLAPVWQEPEESKLYAPGDLERYLRDRIGDADRSGLQAAFPGDDAWHRLAVALGFPRAVETFARLWAARAADDRVADLVEAARQQDQAVQDWYHHSLDPREKMVAIALALFDGLEEDLAFAAIDRLMEGAWSKRDAAFAFIDYGDLTNLGQYFTFDRDESGCGRLRTIGDGTRTHIIAAAWKNQRRQIIAALPELVRLALGSANESPIPVPTPQLDRQLQWLRESVSGAIGEVCRLSLDSAEPHLLQLVGSQHSSAYRVVASALRRVRAAGDGAAVFALLERWRSQSEPLRFLQRTRKLGRAKVSTRIGSAIVHVVGQLALEDAFDALHETNKRLLLAYVSSGNRGIIERLAFDALPRIVPNHPNQLIALTDDILDRARDRDETTQLICLGLGTGFAFAARAHGRPIEDQMERWIADGLEQASGAIDLDAVDAREKRLAMCAHMLGATRSGRRISKGLTPLSAVRKLGSILDVERHGFVREAAVSAVHWLMRFEFEQVAAALPELIERFRPKERHGLVERMVNLHCLQRSRQEGGDTRVLLNGYWCPIWYDSPTPNTLVQDSAFEWSRSARRESGVEFAADVIGEIRSVMEREQEDRRAQLLEERRAAAERQDRLETQAPAEIGHYKVDLGFLERTVAVGLATIDAPEQRHAVSGLLASILRRSDSEAEDVIARFQREQASGLEDVALRARRARWVARNLRTVLGVPAVLIFLLVVAAAL